MRTILGMNPLAGPQVSKFGPAINSITPNPVPWEQLTTLTVNGSNFVNGFTASVNVGGMNYPLSPASLTFVSSSQVQVPVYLGGATSYTATLNITNFGGLTTSQNFQVGSSGGENLQPAISSITPNPVPWEQLTTLTVNGSNFQSGFTVSVNVGGTNYPLSPASLTFVRQGSRVHGKGVVLYCRSQHHQPGRALRFAELSSWLQQELAAGDQFDCAEPGALGAGDHPDGQPEQLSERIHGFGQRRRHEVPLPAAHHFPEVSSEFHHRRELPASDQLDHAEPGARTRCSGSN